MGDYGHDLTFGTFITPSAREPQHAVDLAVATEEAGLDLVTFQDHPYQPAFLDTSTLLAYVAARTERVQLAANVANLPLRPPAVLARAVASLDLLSGGRAVLGLGAGAFWDAIVAMGGRRLEGGQAVQALQEAIEVVRTLWDTSVKGGVRIEGQHYQVVGAKRGPAPAHDVPDLGRCRQAADAAPRRPARRRVAAEPGLARRRGRDRHPERHHRRGGGASRPLAG